MTPSPIHDSDRKAAEEIAKAWYLPDHGYKSDLQERLALIIARHHAEERAAVEKVQKALEDEISENRKLGQKSMLGDFQWFVTQQDRRLREALASLTALRTASQSTPSETDWIEFTSTYIEDRLTRGVGPLDRHDIIPLAARISFALTRYRQRSSPANGSEGKT